MKRILFLIILIVGIVQAEEIIQVEVNDFSYGLNTVSKGFTGNFGEGTTVHNFDLWKHPKSLTVRTGFNRAFSVPGIDSFAWNGVFSYNRLDGNKELLMVADSESVGYGILFSTGANGIEIGTRDSIIILPDTSGQHGNDPFELNPRAYFLRMVAGFLPLGNRNFQILVDSSWSATQIIDTFVIEINADTMGTYITATRSGDTALILVEDANDLNINYYELQFDIQRITPFGTLDNVIATRIPVNGLNWFTQFKGVAYWGGGTAKAYSYDGKVVNKFPMKAPGEADIIPLTTAGNLDGNYRYAMVYGSPDDSVADTLKRTTIGYLSTPIRADSQQILLTDFPLQNVDYYYEGADTVTIEIWRTVGDVGRLDRADSIWYTGISVTMIDSADYANTVVIDTMSDSLIRANGASIIIADGDFHNWQSGKTSIPDSIVHTYISKPGSPSIISWESATGNPGMWGEGVETNTDTVSWLNAAGWSYMCVFVDTNLNSPSDSSRSFNYFQGSNINHKRHITEASYNDSTYLVFDGDSTLLGFSRKNTEKITMVAPRSTGASSQVLLYRGAVIPANYDTASAWGDWQENRGFEWRYNFELLYSDSFAVPFYYLIGAFKPGDTIVDSLCYDSLLIRESYKRNAVPPLIKQMIAVDNQLLATDGQYMYESNPSADSIAFNIFNKSPINLDDGDEITTITAREGAVWLLKNNSTFRLTRNADGFWHDIQTSSNFGSVSSFSYAKAPEGDYVLSHDGVRLLGENVYREKNNIGNLMSGQLNNFTNMSLAEQKGCFAKYIDGKYILSFPDIDTSFVLNKVRLPNGQNRFGWSTWDGIVMTGGDFYAVRKDNIIYPGDTLYFTKSGSNGIYRYGTRTTDNGVDIQYVWASSQLTQLRRRFKQVSRFDIEVESTDTVDGSHRAAFLDERSNTVTALNLLLPPLDSSFIYLYDMPDATTSKSWKVVLLKNILIDGSASGGFGASLIFKSFHLDLVLTGDYLTR